MSRPTGLTSLPHDKLYEAAKGQFERANAIQAGTASYNLACIYGLRGNKEACLEALELARTKVTLPDQADILAARVEWEKEWIDKVGTPAKKEIKPSTPAQFKQKADASKLSNIGKNNPGLLNALKGL